MGWGDAQGLLPGRKTIGPLLLVALTQPFACVMVWVGKELKGDFTAFGRMLLSDPIGSIRGCFYDITEEAVAVVLVFVAFQIALMKLVPGGTSYGPVTKTGHVPEYHSNGLQCFFITISAFLGCSYGMNLFRPEIVYDLFGEIITLMNYSSLVLCAVLQVKGYLWPSTKDCDSSGSIFFDYYRGVELYPRIFTIDVKKLTNCRFGMMSWPVILLSYAAKQESMGGLTDSLMVSVFLQLVYVAKFFLWESGYLRSIDIMHDRAGYYLCWGCCVWVPSFYTIHAFFMVEHPIRLGAPLALFFLIAGWTCIFINYDADRQRAHFRATNGKAPVWGSKPSFITATYTTTDGQERKSLLLSSGWWGLSRHFHYVPEIGGAFFWSVPALFTHAMPYFYVIFLTILLLDRAYRDDKRCGEKYGKYWAEYKRRVPYAIVPGVL